MTRQIVLDTETTGLDASAGHRIIEIGCVEILNRRITGNNYHQYYQPERDIDAAAQEVHGISNEFLADKPLFAAVWEEFLRYVDGAELIIHNAPFDTGFINHELQRVGYSRTIEEHCQVLDSLAFARKTFPGQRNSLDALCKRLEIDNSRRTLHGALLDSEILADVYLRMTGGQTDLLLESDADTGNVIERSVEVIDQSCASNTVVAANSDEMTAHTAWLERLQQESADGCLWQHGQVEAKH